MNRIIICEHSEECSKPGTYSQYESYMEIFNEQIELIDIIPSDAEPCELSCTECGARVEFKACETLKNTRKQKSDQVKQEWKQANLL